MSTYQVKLVGPRDTEPVRVTADRVYTGSGFVRFFVSRDAAAPDQLVRMFKANTVLEVELVDDIGGTVE